MSGTSTLISKIPAALFVFGCFGLIGFHNPSSEVINYNPNKTVKSSLVLTSNPLKGTPTVKARTIEVLEGCPASGVMGQYDSNTRQITICRSIVARSAAGTGVSFDNAYAYVLAHEQAHSRGHMDEPSADKSAVDQMVSEGNMEAVKFAASRAPNGTAYDAGAEYARKILKNTR